MKRLTPKTTEKELQAQVKELCAIFGWKYYHPFLSKWSEKGFPDTVMVKPPRVIFAELKSYHGRLTEEQKTWLALLGGCSGIEVYLWYPDDFDKIAEILSN